MIESELFWRIEMELGLSESMQEIREKIRAFVDIEVAAVEHE